MGAEVRRQRSQSETTRAADARNAECFSDMEIRTARLRALAEALDDETVDDGVVVEIDDFSNTSSVTHINELREQLAQDPPGPIAPVTTQKTEEKK